MLRVRLVALALVGCTPAPAEAPPHEPAPPAPTTAPTVNTALADEIVAMFEADQEVRREFVTVLDDPPEELLERGRAIDAKNTARLREIVDQHGWPGKALVGDEAAGAAIMLVIHADRDPAFQERCLELVMEAAERDDVAKPHAAILVDRVREAQGKKQLYGTQAELVDGKLLPTPIEDPDHVDDRRAAMDMPPLAEHLEQQQAHYEQKMKAAE